MLGNPTDPLALRLTLFAYFTRIVSTELIASAINSSIFSANLSSGRYIIDAKSIMGIFSLDLSAPLRLDIYNDDYEEAVKNALKEFIVPSN